MKPFAWLVSSWSFRKRIASRPASSGLPATRRRASPRLEQLEDRIALSTDPFDYSSLSLVNPGGTTSTYPPPAVSPAPTEPPLTTVPPTTGATPGTTPPSGGSPTDPTTLAGYPSTSVTSTTGPAYTPPPPSYPSSPPLDTTGGYTPPSPGTPTSPPTNPPAPEPSGSPASPADEADPWDDAFWDQGEEEPPAAATLAPEQDISAAPALPLDVAGQVLLIGSQVAGAEAGPGDEPPSTAAPAEPGAVGQYLRHYTHTGGNATDLFYIDVTVRGLLLFGSAGGGPRQTGNVTYTAWRTTLGADVFRFEGMQATFGSDLDPATLSLFQEGLAGGGVIGFNWASFDLTDDDWTWQGWTDTTSYQVSGTYRADDGAIYGFARSYTTTVHWDQTVSWAADPGGDPEAGTRTVQETSRTSYRDDQTFADRLPAATDSGTDEDGRPADLFAGPGVGGSRLTRTFTARTDESKVKVTRTYPAGDGPVVTTVDATSSYDGVDGEYRYTDTSAAPARWTAADGSWGRVITTGEYRRLGEYGGGQTQRLRQEGLGDPTGTVTTRWSTTGQVLADRMLRTEVSARTQGGVQVWRLSAWSTETTPLMYRQSGSATLTLAAAGETTADNGSYRVERRGGAVTVSSTELGRFSQTLAPSAGGGTVSGLFLLSSRTTSREEGVTAGRWDRVAGTGSVDVQTTGGGSSNGLTFTTRTKTAADGTGQGTTVALWTSTGTASRHTTVAGPVTAAGGLSGGTADTGEEWTDTLSGWVWASAPGTAAAPARTELVALERRGSGGRSADLTYRSNGSADGDTDDHWQLTTDETRTVTQRGKYANAFASGTVDAYDRRRTRTNTSSATTLTVLTGVVAGQVSGTAGSSIDAQYRLNRTTWSASGFGVEIVSNTGKWGAEADDAWTMEVAAAQVAAGTRTTSYRQWQDRTDKTTTGQSLYDDAGHTGTTVEQVTGQVRVKDRLTVGSTWAGSRWSESDRRFSVDHYQDWVGTFDQQDDGVGREAAPSGVTASDNHTRAVTWTYEEKVQRAGTPQQYTFDELRDRSVNITDTASGSWTAGDTGMGGRYREKQELTQKWTEQRGGTRTDGQDQLTFQSNVQGVRARTEKDYSSSRETVISDTHVVDFSERRYVRASEMADGGGLETSKTEKVIRITETDRATGRKRLLENINYKPAPKVTPHGGDEFGLGGRWGFAAALWTDFMADPLVQLVASNSGSLMRLAGGAIDVGLGAGLLLGSQGWAVVPAVGLISLGADQIATAVVAMGTGQVRPSVAEYGGAWVARSAGAGEPIAELIGSLTPLALSLSLTQANVVLRAADAGVYPNSILAVYGPGADAAADVLLIARSRQGERVISSLSELRSGETLTVVGHGSPTKLQLGSTVYDAQTLAAELKRLGVQPSAIELIACRTASPPGGGLSFADELAARTGIPVIAYAGNIYVVEQAGGGFVVAEAVANDWLGRLFGIQTSSRRAFWFHQVAISDFIWYRP